MNVRVKLFSSLREGRFEDQILEFPEGTRVADIVASVGIPEAQVIIAFVNSRHALPTDAVKDGDILGLFPPVGGG